jgi:hypothetical protein
MDERLRFVARLFEGEKMASLLRRVRRHRLLRLTDSSEMALRKRAPGTRLQVLLETNGIAFGWEFHRDNERPRTVRDGVAATVIVPLEPIAHAARDADVVA